MTKRRNLATSRKKKEYLNRPPFDLPMGFFEANPRVHPFTKNKLLPTRKF